MATTKHVFYLPLAAFMLLLLLTCISGCNNIPNNGVPIYLLVDSPKVVVPVGSNLGSTSSNIPGVWATTGSHNLGAYEMPVRIPVLAGGAVSFAISAGIYDNGIVNAPIQYPFYAPDTFTIQNATPGHVYHHKPVYSYYAFTQVGVNETFDTDDGFSNINPLTSTLDSNVYEGLRSGGLIIPATADSITALQTTGMSIVTNGRQAYLEFNYRLNSSNVLCDVGIIGTVTAGGQVTQQQTFDKIVLTAPIGIWNKAYLNFNNEIGTFNADAPSGSNVTFQIYFTGYHTAGRADTVFLDNVKLLYFH